jgi:aryl-alcohol dehydrogenase-like predicted oxidoreductase
MNLNDKIGLGTVQFGLNYGINNTAGKVNKDAARNIINDYYKAAKSPLFDTAEAYGNSEQVLGEIFKELNINANSLIISKFSKNITTVSQLRTSFQNTIDKLQVEQLYGFLAHDANTLIENPEIYNELIGYKKIGYIRKIGVSSYYPEQVQWLTRHKISLDLIQIPYNILDRRFEAFLKQFKNASIEIHTRSAFLQGLFFREINSLSSHFDLAKNKIRDIQNIAKSINLSLSKLLLIFCLKQKFIDKVIIGVDSEKHLHNNFIAEDDINKFNKIASKIDFEEPVDLEIILPFNWPKS